MCTFQGLYEWELAHANVAGGSAGALKGERSVFGEVPKALMDLFGRAGLLTRVASRTAKRSPDGPWWLERTGLKDRKKELSKNWEKKFASWCEMDQATLLETFDGIDQLRWPDWASGRNGWTPVVSLVHADLHGQVRTQRARGARCGSRVYYVRTCRIF